MFLAVHVGQRPGLIPCVIMGHHLALPWAWGMRLSTTYLFSLGSRIADMHVPQTPLHTLARWLWDSGIPDDDHKVE